MEVVELIGKIIPVSICIVLISNAVVLVSTDTALMSDTVAVVPRKAYFVKINET